MVSALGMPLSRYLVESHIFVSVETEADALVAVVHKAFNKAEVVSKMLIFQGSKGA